MNTLKKLLGGAIVFCLFIASCLAAREMGSRDGIEVPDHVKLTQDLREEAVSFRERAENSPKQLANTLNGVAEINERLAGLIDKKADFIKKRNMLNAGRVQRDIDKMWADKDKAMQDAQKAFAKIAKAEQNRLKEQTHLNENKSELAKVNKVLIFDPKKVEADIRSAQGDRPTETAKKSPQLSEWPAYE